MSACLMDGLLLGYCKESNVGVEALTTSRCQVPSVWSQNAASNEVLENNQFQFSSKHLDNNKAS
jgi:hypothetical protein